MTLTAEQWKKILSAVNLNKYNRLEAIKEELKNKDSSTYEGWKRNGFCINHEFDVEDNILNKLSLLHIAVICGYLKVVKYLKEQGADVNLKTNNRYIPLHLAVINGHLDIVKYLKEQGADVNLQDNYDYTALYLAAFNGHLDIVKYLKEQGADSSLKNRSGKTPKDLAKDENIIQLLTNGTEKTAPGASFEGDVTANGKITPQPESVMPIINSGENNQSHNSVRDFGQSVGKSSSENIVEMLYGTRPIDGCFNQQNFHDDDSVNDTKISSEHSTHPEQAALLVNQASVSSKNTDPGPGHEAEKSNSSLQGIQHNAGQPTNNSGKNDTTSQNTKSSKLPFIAASFAITGVVTGIAIAVYLEMLAVGIVVGACCLVAAAIIYCYRPKTLIENDNIKKSFGVEKEENVEIT